MDQSQIANICWIIEKAIGFQKNIYFCFIDYIKAFDCVDHNKLENSERDRNTRPPDLPLEKPIRSEEHTSELQSPKDLVCRLLLEKKKKRGGRSARQQITGERKIQRRGRGQRRN